ncbi:hypothetical protein HYU93_02895 [Candidatus Daviesbacteria bacterium]|nr:hypothetical protein [Candidatus Daviesbacteria bacterium]
MKISEIKLRIIPDSRDKDTLEGILRSANLEASGQVPSGKSTGKTEAAVVAPQKALEKVNWLNSQIKDHEFATLEEFDHFLISLDGTLNKQNLGGNTILSLSMAFTRLLAKQAGVELFEMISKISGNQVKLPFCFFNLIEGGVHAENSLPFQEYLFIPQVRSAKESLEMVTNTVKLLGDKINKEYGSKEMGDEGGFTIAAQDPLVGLQVLQQLIDQDKLKGKIGLDVAASVLLKDGKYQAGDKSLSRQDLIDLYQKIADEFSVLSMEDPFDEEDWQGFSQLASQIGDKIWIIGDDLLTTNVGRIQKAYQEQAVNAVLIKPNQIGSVSETIQAVNLAKSYGWKIVVSHRSGETRDTFIADLAVGVGADGLKSGCPLQKERLVKYERLVEIESSL